MVARNPAQNTAIESVALMELMLPPEGERKLEDLAIDMAADEPRRNDLDGRGSLSQSALTDFCDFFLCASIDQVDFMESLLQPSELLRRIHIFVEDEIRAGRLPRGSYPVLREAVLAGDVDRALARQLTGFQERMGRTVISKLLGKGTPGFGRTKGSRESRLPTRRGRALAPKALSGDLTGASKVMLCGVKFKPESLKLRRVPAAFR